MINFRKRTVAALWFCALVSTASAQVISFSKGPRDLQVYRRDLTYNNATVEIAGNVSTPGYDKVVLSVLRDRVPYAAYAQDLSYVNNAAAFSFSQTIIAELKNYDFSVSLVTGTVTNVVKVVTNVVAGDFFMANGQSNAAAGRSQSNSNQVQFLRSFGTRDYRTSVLTNDPNWHIAEGSQSEGPGAVGAWCMRFGRLIVDTYGIPVAIQSGARASTAISYFQRNDSWHDDPASNYGGLLWRMEQAGCTNGVRAYLYWQGETDRLNPITHLNGFSAIYTRWQEDYPNLEKVYVEQIRHGYCAVTNYYDTALRDIQRLFPRTLSKVTTLSANGLDGHDGCHCADIGYEEAGQYFFNIMARDLYGSSNTNNVESPDVERAYSDSPDRRTVTLVMRNRTDTLAIDPGAETDFFYENKGYLAPTNGTVVSNTIVLTFPRNCLGATGVSYTGHPFDGAWVKNGLGVGLLTFRNVPIELPFVALPGVENQAATNIGATSADFVGTLVNEGQGQVYVWVYHGTTDGGTNATAWDNLLSLGTRSGAGTTLTTNISGLPIGAQYFYRYFASNSAGVFWANTSAKFQTAPAASITTSSGATNITAASATLQGNLEDAGTSGASTRVYVYWGMTDGAASASAWDHVIDCGLRTPGKFSTNATGLAAATRYYYRCLGSNSLGAAWTTNTATFPTLASNATWSSQSRITFGGYSRSEILTNFPALVILNESIPGFRYSQFGSASGDDLRFFDPANTELNYEIDQWNYNGSSYVWVQVPRITNSASWIVARWGNAAATRPAYTTNGAVWADGYAGVWHMSSQPLIVDSTGNKNHGTPYGNVWTTNGLGAGAQWFYGQNHEYKWLVWEEDAGINVVHFPRPENMTVSAWIAAPPFGAARDILAWTPTATSAEFRLMDVGRLWYGETASGTASLYAPASIADGTLKFVSVTRKQDGSTILYVDGVQAASGKVAVGTPASTTLRIGARALDDYNFSGVLDELRIENVVRSADWLWSCRMNQASNQVFITYAAVTNLEMATVVDNNAGAANVTFNSATLNGNLVSTNATPTSVWVYWGITDGGASQAAWANAVPLGAVPLGAFSANLTGLSGSTTYYYRCYASNAVSRVWAATSASFTTLSGQPLIQNAAPSGVTIDSASLNGNLLSAGSTPANIWVYWGTSDGGPAKANWPSAIALGQQPAGSLATLVSSLAYNTTYYYRYYASNSAGESWAAPAAGFTTLNPLAVITNRAAAAIGTNSASLKGQLVSAGAAPAYVQVYWGTNDGATLKSDWKAVTNLGPASVGPINVGITNLIPSTRYYYRCLATNNYGESWAGVTESFSTTSPGGGGGTWYWDKGGDASTWASENNWSNVTTHVNNNGYPNGPAAVAVNVNGTISANPQDLTLGEIYNSGVLTLGSDTGTTTNTLTFDNNGGRAVLVSNGTTSSMLYYLVDLTSDLYVTNSSSGALYFYRRGLTGPGKELHITTLGSGGVRFSMEDPATGWNTFGNLHIHENSLFQISESLRTPARTPMGQGDIFFYSGSQLAVILRLSITNNLQLLGNATVTFDGTRADGVQLNGTISGTGRLTINNTATASLGNVKLGGSAPNTYAGGTIVKGAAGTGSNFLVLQKDGAAGTGDVFLTNQFARLQITDSGGSENRIHDGALIYMAHSGANYARMTLDANVNETIGGLYFDGVSQAAGTYGSTTSLAANKDDNWFSGTGILTVFIPPAGQPPVITNTLASAITFNTALLSGTLVSTGTAPTMVWAYYGNSDGGTAKASWTATAPLGTQGAGPVAAPVQGLIPSTPYFYRLYASNSFGESWAPASSAFTTLSSAFSFTAVTPGPEPGRLVLKWESIEGKLYTVSQATNLVNPNWAPLNLNIPATPPLNTFTTPPASFETLFYRVSTQ